MTPLVVVILALMWVVVLVPPLLRSRTDGRPAASIHSFRRQLSTLGRATPVYARSGHRPAAVRAPQRSHGGYPGSAVRGYSLSAARPSHAMSQRMVARQRRQSVLLTLVGAAFLSGVVAFGLGVQAAVWVHLAIDGLLLAYVYLLISMRKAEEQRAYRSARYYEAA